MRSALEERFWRAKQEYPQWLLKEFNRIGTSEDLRYIENLAFETHIVLKKSPPNFNHGLLLFVELSKYCSRLKKHDRIFALDVGTARGFSALVMAYVIQKFQLAATILSIDIIGHYERRRWNCILDGNEGVSRAEIVQRHFGSDSILFVKGDSRKVLRNLGVQRVNFAFLDGNHEWPSLKAETEFILGRQTGGDVIVFDDYSPKIYPGVVKAVSNLNGVYNIDIRGDVAGRAYAVTKKI